MSWISPELIEILLTVLKAVVILLVGEVTPKNIAKEHAETIAMKFYPLTKEKMEEIQEEVARIKLEAQKAAKA